MVTVSPHAVHSHLSEETFVCRNSVVDSVVPFRLQTPVRPQRVGEIGNGKPATAVHAGIRGVCTRPSGTQFSKNVRAADTFIPTRLGGHGAGYPRFIIDAPLPALQLHRSTDSHWIGVGINQLGTPICRACDALSGA